MCRCSPKPDCVGCYNPNRFPGIKTKLQYNSILLPANLMYTILPDLQNTGLFLLKKASMNVLLLYT